MYVIRSFVAAQQNQEENEKFAALGSFLFFQDLPFEVHENKRVTSAGQN